jgi:hypothetical protein
MDAAHGNKDIDDLILRLLRDPRFPGKVNDIVVECGNSLYQGTLDRYIAGGRLLDPKTLSGTRSIGISPQLAEHLRSWLTTWRPNERRLLFATRKGSPWDHNLLRKRQFRKLLRELRIEVPRGGGFHAFRRLNATLLDRYRHR